MKRNMFIYALAVASIAAMSACNRSASAADQYPSANRADRSDDSRYGSSSSRDESGAASRGAMERNDDSSYGSSGSSKSTMSDSMITAKVKAALLAEPSLKSSGINVQTNNGVVQLNGFVPTRDDIDRAASAARDVKDVKSVKNNLKVR